MSRTESTNSEPVTHVLARTLVGLYLVEAFVVIGIFIVYKTGYTWPGAALSNPLGIASALALTCLVCGLILLLRDLRSQSRRPLVFTAYLNLFSVLLLIATAEAGSRLAIMTIPEIDSVLPRGLLPKSWSEVRAKNLRILDEAKHAEVYAGAFLVPDDTLGWTIGAGKISRNGMFVSGLEGIRSATPNQSFADTGDRRRIALIGDSYTFGTGVAFDETWGQNLQRSLGSDFQVLNFGVGGYGVDQIYLRYLEDVRPWNPEFIIIGLISHDLNRSEVVYPFLSFPKWEFPFSKPRFVVKGDRAVLTNVPLSTPEELFAIPAVAELPAIDLEPSYFQPEWEWHWFHNLFSVRLVTSLSPRWPPENPSGPESRVRLNTAIISELVGTIIENHSKPIVVFFPSFAAGEVAPGSNTAGATRRPIHDVLSGAGIDYLDLTACLLTVSAGTALASDGVHYSGSTNSVVAGCIYRHIEDLIRSE